MYFFQMRRTQTENFVLLGRLVVERIHWSNKAIVLHCAVGFARLLAFDPRKFRLFAFERFFLRLEIRLTKTPTK